MRFSYSEFIGPLTLRKILGLALFFRLLAAFFSRGYAMYDDHFWVIEIAQNWVDGHNIDNWLPDVPHGFTEAKCSMFYVGFNFLLLKFLQMCRIYDPQVKMLLIRIFHAFYSLLVVFYGYKIALKLANETVAKYTGLLLGLLWFIPNLSVRNLVEMFCIPPLLFGVWALLDNRQHRIFIVWAGFITGFAFSVRYQTALFIVGMGLVLLVQSRVKDTLCFAIGVALNVLVFQLTIDLLVWGHPFAQIIAYIKFNVLHRSDFVTGPWYNYLLLVTGLVLPPLSLFFWYGYFRAWRKYLPVFLPSLLFLIFHSSFPNKQERFILPFVPFFVIAGCGGWYDFQMTSAYWQRNKIMFHRLILFFAVINAGLLLICSVASTKTSKMDAMYYLYKRGDTRSFVVEGSYQGGVKSFPLFYLGRWVDWYFLTSSYSAAQLRNDIRDKPLRPNYVIFLSDKDLKQRVDKFEQSYPGITFLQKISPSFIDRVFFKLNPVNQNEPCFIYKIDD